MKRALSDWEIMFQLLDHGPKTAAELVAATNLKKPAVHRALHRLEKTGMVKIDGWGERVQNHWPMKWGLGDRVKNGVQRGA